MAKYARVKLHAKAGSSVVALDSLPGLTAYWWDAAAPHLFTSAPAAPSVSMNADGDVEANISASSTAVGSDGFLLILRRSATAASDLVFAGKVTVQS